MSESLGLSIGVANLVGARAGSAPVRRSSVLTLFDDRASEVGLPEENPNLTQPGLVMRGFVERVGDRSPLVAADGTKYLGEALTVDALEAIARTVGYGSPVTIAVPAYWSEGQTTALRNEFFAQPGLSANGVPPVLISDSTAALAALRAQPGFPTQGCIALCDFGAGGTSITLADAGSNGQQIGSTVRYPDFSGEAIDELVANYVRSGGQDAATSTDVGATLRTGAVARLLGECQRAKEQLSTAAQTAIATGSGADFRLSRTEFEQLIAQPLDRFLATVEDLLQRNGIPRANLAAVATVGGGAGIPLVGRRLSERLQAPIITTPEPTLSAANGAAALGSQGSAAGAATAAGAVVETPTELVTTVTTEAAPALAWSQDAAGGEEPVPYTGPEHTRGYGQEPAASQPAVEDHFPAEPGPLPWYKRTALVVTVAAAAAAVLVAVSLALTMGNNKPGPANTTTETPSQTPETVTTTLPNGSVVTSVVPAPPPPPSSNTTQSPSSTTTSPSTTTTTTTTTSKPSTTTTTQQSTTTSPSTSTQHTLPTLPTRRPNEPPVRP